MELNQGGGTSSGGTVTTVSVASANGFSGTVTNPTTTPAITLSTTDTTGSVLFASSGALGQDNANFFWDNSNKRLGVKTATPGYPIEVLNPTSGTVERLIGATNANVASSTSLIKGVGFGVGNGSSYSNGYAVLWGQLGTGTFIRWMDLTAFGTNFILPLFLTNNKGVQSATTLGQTINLAIVTAGNVVQLGANYPAAIPVEFYIGNTTVNYTWKETNTATTLMTLTGTGALTTKTYIKTETVVVASLTAAATAGAGARSFVTDALAPAWGTAVVGGGTVKVPVFSDGTNWNVG